MDGGDDPVAVGAQHVLHLHGFDHRQFLAGLDRLARLDGHRDQESGHGRQQIFERVVRLLRRHERMEFGGAPIENDDIGPGAGVSQAVADGEAFDLQAQIGPVDAGAKQGLAQLPGGAHLVTAGLLGDVEAPVHCADGHRMVFALEHHDPVLGHRRLAAGAAGR